VTTDDEAPASGTVHLRAQGVSLLLSLTPAGLPQVVHWGSDLGPLSDDGAVAAAQAVMAAVPHSGLDQPPPLELLPQAATGHAGRGVLAGSRAGSSWSPLFQTVETTASDQQLLVDAVDVEAGLTLRTVVSMEPQGVLRIRHTVRNDGEDAYHLDSLPVQLFLPGRAEEVLDLTGRWSRERVPQRHPLGYGAWVREGRRGRTGHDAPFLMVAGTPGFGFRHGEVWGMHVAWSGDSSSWAERLPEGRVSLGGAELLHSGEVVLDPGVAYTTPWVYAVHSTDGLDGLSHRLHDWMRARARHPRSPRPVVLNTWEAVYFDHDLAHLSAIAEHAAEIGVERFVLDDGWFTGRTSDRAGLGDWSVSAQVWPTGLNPLIERVTSLGMDFGLWVEPEMVNLDSDLARAHPDWVLAPAERMPPEWRHQQVLDLANPEAWQHILERLDSLLSEHDIAYLKWDHNRDLVDADHGGRPAFHAQTLACYALLDELRARHPGVEIETCASGGGRIDLEILERTDRVWASDCTDALERQEIQRWTGLLVPPELVGAHVGAPCNHQTGRVLDLPFRAGTALFGHFGVEWDLSAATPEERTELGSWIAAYKSVRTLLHTGDVVRADHTEDGILLHGVVDRDQNEALFALVQLRTLTGSIPARVQLPGLDPAKTYRVRLQPPGDAPRTMQTAPPAWLMHGETVLRGSVLTTVGLAPPILAPEQLLLLRVIATSPSEGLD
jgi:alpha-galactosidase